MNRIPKPMEQYRHFKGGRYQILNIAEMEDTGEQIVIYQALYGDGKIWARRLDDFVSEVDHAKYPEVRQKWRFERIVPPEPEESTIQEVVCSAASAPVGGSILHSDNTMMDAVSSSGSEYNDNGEGRISRETRTGTKEDTNQEAGTDQQAEYDSEESSLDPMVEQFLDADTVNEKLNILAGMRNRVTDDMIDTMAMASGVEVDPGPVEARYADLRDCLLTISRYEQQRRQNW